jgi:hypothetical protein
VRTGEIASKLLTAQHSAAASAEIYPIVTKASHPNEVLKKAA